MLKFYKLTKKAINKVESFTKNSKHPFCDYSVGVLFTWFIGFKTSYAIWDETLILKVGNKNPRFLMPLGKNVNGAITEIENYCKEKGIALKFISVSDEWAENFKLKYDGKIKCRFNRDYSDYIYDYLEIYSFSGKKFSGQRNHINAFKKLYFDYKYKKITKKDIPKIHAFLKEYDKQYPIKRKMEKKELEITYKYLELLFKSNMFGGYIEYNGEVVSMAIGEYVGDMLIIHIEKALLKYRGAYPLTYNEFVKNNYKEGILWVDRQDDSGDMGLRISKTQYKPVRLENKNYVTVKSAMPKIKKPKLIGEKVVLNAIKKSDAKTYYNLSVQKANNKWWGYDYKKDNNSPQIDYFYKMQKRDFSRLNGMSLAIRRKNSEKMIGEVVLYKFSYQNTVEIGIRLFKRYQGKGFASESLNLVLSYIKNVLNLTPVMKCYKNNLSSKNLILKCGFTLVKEDKKFFYFEKQR
jgi:RimJ/RimL family protein N-acetyltransferase